MSKVDIAGLKIDAIAKKELLDKISDRINSDRKTFVITPYSEFLYRCLRDPGLLDIFNQADFSVPDGIGIFWAAKFLSIPLTAKNYYGKILQAFWQMIYTGAAILAYPKFISSALNNPTLLNDRSKVLGAEIDGEEMKEGGLVEEGSVGEKIPGSELVWDLAKLASEQNQSIYLLGGFGDTPELVANQLISKLADLKIAGYSNKGPQDPTVIDDIKKASPDMIFVAYGPIKQERWIVANMQNLPAKLYIGLGGTFDYIAGKHVSPPQFVRSMGLEWLWRLITQPHRIGRIWQATVGLMTALVRYKVVSTLPLRKNVASVILNTNNAVLICKRNSQHKYSSNGAMTKNSTEEHWQFPQGGREDGEPVETTAMREASEEVGLTNFVVFKISPHTNSYQWANKQRRLLFDPQFSGQEQAIVYLKYTGKNTDVKVDEKEFLDYRWVNIQDLEKQVHPQRLSLAKIIQEDLKDLA